MSEDEKEPRIKDGIKNEGDADNNGLCKAARIVLKIIPPPLKLPAIEIEDRG